MTSGSLPTRIIIDPDEAIPPLPYDGELSLRCVIDEAIAVAEDDRRNLLREIETGIMLGAMLWIVGLVIWLAW